MPRGKTFTGCWTCRDRRVKCDEVRPVCAKCSIKNLTCGGYGSRLCWLDPQNPNAPVEPQKPVGKGLQRRRLLPANGIHRLADDQLDVLLFNIDKDIDRGQHCQEGPFGVFSPALPTTDHDASPIILSEADSPAFSTYNNQENPIVADISPGTASTQIVSAFLHPTTSQGDPDIDPTIHASLQPYGDDFDKVSVSQTSLSARQDSAYSTITSPVCSTSAAVTGSPISATVFGNSSLNRLKFLTPEVKHLLNHYRANVLPFFSVMDNMHTPWRVFHFPKVLQAACEKELGNSTDGPSNILLYAILAISAYNLQNSEEKQRLSRSSNHWMNVATRYKGEALKLLNIHIAMVSDTRTESDYHELLAAMLSMVTIDVMCGDTGTCGIHLQACETLISAYVVANLDGLSITSKALHTIFLYLRVMQQAAPVMYLEVHPPLDSSLHALRSEPKSNDFCAFVELGQPDDVCFDSFSSEMIYGFPVRLLFFLHATLQTAKVIGRARTFPMSPGLVKEHIANRDGLEETLLDWPVEDVVMKYKGASLKPGNREIMEHYTRAFHHALVIFWFDKVHHSRRRLFQRYVESVIDQLELAERAKTKHGIVAGPLLWPAFIAAQQSTDPEVQDRFLRWLETSDQVGVGTSKATVILLKQLWTKSSCSDQDDVDDSISRLHLVLT